VIMSYLKVAITIYEDFERNINSIGATDAIRGYT
jgi:hypothetical protein